MIVEILILSVVVAFSLNKYLTIVENRDKFNQRVHDEQLVTSEHTMEVTKLKERITELEQDLQQIKTTIAFNRNGTRI